MRLFDKKEKSHLIIEILFKKLFLNLIYLANYGFNQFNLMYFTVFLIVLQEH